MFLPAFKPRFRTCALLVPFHLLIFMLFFRTTFAYGWAVVVIRALRLTRPLRTHTALRFCHGDDVTTIDAPLKCLWDFSTRGPYRRHDPLLLRQSRLPRVVVPLQPRLVKVLAQFPLWYEAAYAFTDPGPAPAPMGRGRPFRQKVLSTFPGHCMPTPHYRIPWGLRARDCGRRLSLSRRLVSQPLWPTISSLAAPSVWSLLPPPSLSSLLGDATASVLVGCDLACANCWAYSIVWNTSSLVILTADYINTAVFCIVGLLLV